MGFDWRTEDDNAWEKDLVEDPAGTSHSRRRLPRWQFMVAGVVAVVALAFWLLNRQSEEAVSAVRDEVLSSHNLVLDTIARQDRELFEGQLDWRESSTGWLRTQKRLFDVVGLLDRATFGLAQMAPDGDPVVELAPDLTAATVTFAYTYAATVPTRDPAGVEEAVRLEQTFRYRLEAGNGRWLLTEPPDDFWGEWRTFASDRLALTYPARDEAVAERLAEAVDAVLDVLCAQVAVVDCADALDLAVRLETDPDAWDALLPQQRQPLTGGELSLPTPTLVGLPLDESGYQALYRGYATQVVLAAIEQMEAAGATIATHDFLIQVRLRPWPLLETRGRRITDAPVPLEQSVQMLCKVVAPAGTLLRFDPVTANQTIQLPGRTFLEARTAADDTGLFLLERRLVDGESRIHLIRWQEGSEQLLFAESWTPEEGPWQLGLSSPSERYIVLIHSPAESNSRFVNPTFVLVDLSACDGNGCDSRQIAGYPTWSPDERYVLVQQMRPNDANLVLRGDGELQALVQVGQGWNPAWIDADTYGYQSVRGNVIVADVVSMEAATAIEADDVRAAFPDDEADPVTLSLLADPAGQDYVFAYQIEITNTVINVDGSPTLGSAKGILFPLAEADGTLVSDGMAIPGGHFFQPRLAPDGRWLYFLERLLPAGDGWHLQLYALPPSGDGPLELSYERYYPDAGPSLPFIYPQVAWSADGEWLLVSYDGVVDLIAPAEAYHRVVVPETPGCVFDWIE